MTERYKANQKAVKLLLQTKQGEQLLEWMKVRFGFNDPIYLPQDDYNETAAKLREGGRHVIIELESMIPKFEEENL